MVSSDPFGLLTPLVSFNYQAGSSSSSSSSSGGCDPSDDTNRTTQFAYTPDGQQATLVAVNARTGDQTTTWTFGTTLSNSDIASSQLLLSVTYPDSVGGSDLITYSYNRQGQKTTLTDQRGCVHTCEFDKLGRMIHDRVTTVGSGVDNAVLRLSTSYEVRGMATKLTSWNNANIAAGSVVNECQFVYNNFGQLITDYQEHGGAVNTSTAPKVQYGYADGSANSIRPTTRTYPNGRVLNYNYSTANGINDAISRVTSLIDDDMSATHLADYSFLGLAATVVVDYTQPGVKYTLVSLTGTNDPDTGDIYSGVDRFGRVKDCRTYNYGSSTDVVRLQYGNDRASNRLWRADVIAQSLSKDFDEIYSYDGLHRLKDMQRGLLNGGHTSIGSETFAQCWGLDTTNNWKNFKEACSGGAWSLVQNRTANTVNEITRITNTVGTPWAAPAFDPAGNTTTIPKPGDPTTSFTGTYDPWNRLVKLLDTATSQTVQQNQYDARMYRTVRSDYTSGTLDETRHFYYSAEWQSLEERLGTSPSSATAERQHAWGLPYIDEIVLRDRDTNGDGSLDERLYGIQDADWNTVALIDTTAAIIERCIYTPFGTPAFLNADMSVVSTNSTVDNRILFTGQLFDFGTRFHLFRLRWLDSTTGTFLGRDPLQYVDGPSLYAPSFILGGTDPLGLAGTGVRTGGPSRTGTDWNPRGRTDPNSRGRNGGQTGPGGRIPQMDDPVVLFPGAIRPPFPDAPPPDYMPPGYNRIPQLWDPKISYARRQQQAWNDYYNKPLPIPQQQTLQFQSQLRPKCAAPNSNSATPDATSPKWVPTPRALRPRVNTSYKTKRERCNKANSNCQDTWRGTRKISFYETICKACEDHCMQTDDGDWESFHLLGVGWIDCGSGT